MMIALSCVVMNDQTFAWDEVLRRGVLSRFRSSRHAALAWLDCRVKNRVLVISGFVSTFYLKQLAQEAAKGVPGLGKSDRGPQRKDTTRC